MTNFEKIKSFGVDEMAGLFTTICSERDKIILEQLQKQGYDCSTRELSPDIQKAIYKQYLLSPYVDERTRAMVDFYMDNGTCFDCDQDPTQCMAKGYCVYER